MIRSLSLCLFSALVGLVACGGNIARDTSDSTSGSAAGGGSGSTPTSGVSSSVDAGGRCNLPPPPSPTTSPPFVEGCFSNAGSGWVSIPCVCELWLPNTTHASFTVGIKLTVVTPPDQASTGTRDTHVAFDDPDASWYAAWKTQAGNGDAFALTHEGGTTTVSVSETGVTMMPVPVGACTTVKAHAQVIDGTTLSIEAFLDNGVPLAALADCHNPPHPTPRRP